MAINRFRVGMWINVTSVWTSENTFWRAVFQRKHYNRFSLIKIFEFPWLKICKLRIFML